MITHKIKYKQILAVYFWVANNKTSHSCCNCRTSGITPYRGGSLQSFYVAQISDVWFFNIRAYNMSDLFIYRYIESFFFWRNLYEADLTNFRKCLSLPFATPPPRLSVFNAVVLRFQCS